MDIVYQDQDLIIVNKPSGWVSCGKTPDKAIGNVEQWLEDNHPWSRELLRHGVLHRLDKDTTGLLMIGKNAICIEKMQKVIKNREIVKKYYALVEGKTVQNGIELALIGKSNYFAKRKVVIGGRPAETYFSKIHTFVDESKKYYSLLEVEIKTGRTHQIRVHLAYLGWPVAGDRLYGNKNTNFPRHLLQAYYLKFKKPDKEQVVEVQISLDPLIQEHIDGWIKC